ncbi:MAG: amidohydrolase [Deltaproteobacteria bacterium]|nr:amidohydrolase [Deltaproteobacteria bacterium]
MRKIFDFHIHAGHLPDWTMAARKFWMETGPYSGRLFTPEGRFDVEALEGILEAEGVVGGVLLPEYAPETAALVPVERVIEISRELPRMVPFGALNPHLHADPAAEFERQLDLGVKGLKIHGVHCLHRVNDPRLYPAYEICRDRDLPLMLHAGTSIFPGVRLRHADPYDFDDIAVDFPDLKVILCHGGRGFWYQLAEFMVQRHERVWIDLSGLPPKNLLRYYPKLEKLSHRFVFGTDFPGVPGIAANAAAITALGLSDEALERIFLGNARRLLPGLIAD